MKTTAQEQEDLQELLFEYDQLRKEILQNDVLTLQILGTTILLVTAIFSVVFSQALQASTGKGFLFFLATAIAIIGMLQSVDRERSSFVNASYLRTFTEKKLKHVKWETRLFRFRTTSSRTLGFTALASHQLTIYTILVGVTFLLGTLYTVIAYLAHPLFNVLVISLVVALIVTLGFIYNAWRNHVKYVFKYGNTFDPEWSRIKDEENKPKAKSGSR